MKKILLTIIIATTLSGCGGDKPIPSSRLSQPVGDFSFVTPDGWFRNKLAGIDFIVVSTEPDYGMNPNIFVDFVIPSPELDDAVAKATNSYETNHRDYEVIEKVDFKTESGLQGVKITARRLDKKKLPLGTYQYVIKGSDRAIVITCTCAEAVKEKYEPLFDQAMRTLETEK